MTIPTQMSLQGFIATTPELGFTSKGHARLFCRVGIEQHRKEVDGSFTKLDPVYCNLVMFDRSAERAYARLKPGDLVVASGYVHEYEQERPGGPSQIREQFVARRIGHDCVRTRYVVDRAPIEQAEPPIQSPTQSSIQGVTVADSPAQAVGI
jgi:single-stranded DNA-binding protein